MKARKAQGKSPLSSCAVKPAHKRQAPTQHASTHTPRRTCPRCPMDRLTVRLMRTQSETNPRRRTRASLGRWGSEQSVRRDRADQGHGALTLSCPRCDVSTLFLFFFGSLSLNFALAYCRLQYCVVAPSQPASLPAKANLGLALTIWNINLPSCIPALRQIGHPHNVPRSLLLTYTHTPWDRT